MTGSRARDADTRPTKDAFARRRRWVRRTAGAAVVALLVVGCGSGDDVDRPSTAAAPSEDVTPQDDAATPTPASEPEPTPTDVPSEPATTPPPPPSPVPSPSSPAPSPSPSPSTQPESALPGAPYDDPYIDEGDVLGVVGVAHDDVLNVRARPTVAAPILTTAHPTESGLVATGRSRVLDGPRFWHEVTVHDVTGWVSWRYVSFIGPTWDETSRFIAQHGVAHGATMAALGREVAAHYEASDEVVSRVVMSVAPSYGDVAEVTYDVLDILDDAGLGYRLHVFARPDADGEGFTLRSLELTDLCRRGGSPDDPCV